MNYIKFATVFLITVISASHSFADLAEVNKKEIFVIQNLERAVELNNMPAMQIADRVVDAKGEERVPVLVFINHDFGSEFKHVNIKPSNLRKLKTYPDQELSLDEILANLQLVGSIGGYREREIDFLEKAVLKSIAISIKSIVSPKKPDYKDKNLQKWRLIGAYLAERHGIIGMRFITSYLSVYDVKYTSMISATWDKLGNWMN